MRVSVLSGVALDWAVAKAEDYQCRVCDVGLQFSEKYTWCWRMWSPSTDWNQAGPIIDREGITTTPDTKELWLAHRGGDFMEYSRSPLIAAMRCYVASKLGEEIEIPKELLK